MKETDFIGNKGRVYNIVWDGWNGELKLLPGPGPAPMTGFPNVKPIHGILTQGGINYDVGGYILHNPQDKNKVTGTGPGYKTKKNSSTLNHRIVFWVAFQKSPKPTTIQWFDGYLMTQTKDAIAGVTWWQNIPFGFYAIKKSDIK